MPKQDKKQPKPLKPLEERKEEAETLLTKFNELGVPDSVIGYSEMKKQLDDWANGGSAWEGKIKFPSFGRTAHLLLPTRIGCKATAAFKLDAGATEPPAKL